MIDIKEIIPFMKKGWVAMDKSCDWWWYPKEPYTDNDENEWVFIDRTECPKSAIKLSNLFDIAPADDWTKSLIKIDNTAREKFEEEYQNNIQRTIQELKQDD